jgi:putative redox protein
MKSTLLYKGGMLFAGSTPSGHTLLFDSAPAGESSAGPTPIETVMLAAASCSAMDVAAILKKRRKEITLFEVEVNAERKDEHPKVLKNLDIKYRVQGPDLTQEEVEKAVWLSQEKYCSVLHMLKPVVHVTYSVQVN